MKCRMIIQASEWESDRKRQQNRRSGKEIEEPTKDAKPEFLIYQTWLNQSPQALRNEGEAAIKLRRITVNIEVEREKLRGKWKRKYNITNYDTRVQPTGTHIG